MNLDTKTRVGLKLIYLSSILHILGLFGIVGGSPTRHIIGVIIPLILNLWMILGLSKIPWILNIANTSISAILMFIYGISLFSSSIIWAITFMIYAVIFGNLCRQLCSKEVTSYYI
ncbi:hypothetical protein P0Y35_13920 [Kiritimatiellaeota bacterium B1221]|nr:hypothetical protein [Kiritimatiellaeota bacterium B1221]